MGPEAEPVIVLALIYDHRNHIVYYPCGHKMTLKSDCISSTWIFVYVLKINKIMKDKDAENIGLKMLATTGHRQFQQLGKEQLTLLQKIYGTCNPGWKYYLEGNLSIKV